jgi:hypothetical protein
VCLTLQGILSILHFDSASAVSLLFLFLEKENPRESWCLIPVSLAVSAALKHTDEFCDIRGMHSHDQFDGKSGYFMVPAPSILLAYTIAFDLA